MASKKTALPHLPSFLQQRGQMTSDRDKGKKNRSSFLSVISEKGLELLAPDPACSRRRRKRNEYAPSLDRKVYYW